MNSVVDAIDYGAYSHFDWLAQWQPGVVRALRVVNDIATSDIALGLLALAILFIFLARGPKRTALAALAVVVAGYLLATFLPPLLGRERPSAAAQVLDEAQMNASFPARGVLLFTLAAVLLGQAVWPFLRHRWLRVLVGLLLALAVVTVCMAQFYLRLHFVTDVVVGLLAGVGLGLAVRVLSPYQPDVALPSS